MSVITGFADNIYARDTLAEAMRRPLKQFISRIDTSQETIQSADSWVWSRAFQKTTFEVPGQFDFELDQNFKDKWRMKLYGASTETQKVECHKALEENLRKSWEEIAQKSSAHVFKGPLACVEGDIDITVSTTMENVIGATLTHTFQKKFRIQQLTYPVDLSDLSSDQLKRVQSQFDDFLVQVKSDSEGLDGLLDYYKETASKLKLRSVLV